MKVFFKFPNFFGSFFLISNRFELIEDIGGSELDEDEDKSFGSWYDTEDPFLDEEGLYLKFSMTVFDSKKEKFLLK